ncbi:hypothetical protein CEXT_616341 [Caerostris extrusa]|uniref:Uncharacterized protein n=1 Tax=Caerostris extrusa TaxID=172846 RepID=A0AAV4W8A3_CAEEX|nr:hypothetical protein CEXT_616341 [Caerostris extrusa]
MEDHCSVFLRTLQEQMGGIPPRYKQNNPHDFPILLNPPPAIMGYPTASSSFSAVAVCYVRFTEPRPRLHSNEEVFLSNQSGSKINVSVDTSGVEKHSERERYTAFFFSSSFFRAVHRAFYIVFEACV